MTTKRLDHTTVNLLMARATSLRSTCARRAVGCVLTNSRGHIIGTGYNGPASGQPHCNEGHPCEGHDAPSGSGLDKCNAIHAEQNALLQCKNVYEIDTVYTTLAPCVTCTKLLLNTSANHIVFIEPYSAEHLEKFQQLWTGYVKNPDSNFLYTRTYTHYTFDPIKNDNLAVQDLLMYFDDRTRTILEI